MPRIPAAPQPADRRFAAFAESVELAIVGVYDAIVDLLPEDLAPVAETIRARHRDHADALGELAGDQATGEPNARLVEVFAPAIDGLNGAGSSLRLAKGLEDQLVTTYVAAMATLESPEAATVVATIAPVAAAHAVTLADLVDERLDEQLPMGAVELTDPALGFDPITLAVA